MVKKETKGSNSSGELGEEKKSRGRPRKTVPRKPKKPKEFRINAKKLLLTYSQCPLEISSVHEQLMNKLSPYRVLDHLIVKELHQDGNTHYHVLVACEKKVDRKGAEFLDIEGTSESGETVTYHGRYEPCKSEEDTIQYLTKDVFNAQEATENLRISPGYSRRLGEIYEYLSLSKRMIALARQGLVTEAMELLRNEDPDKFLDQGSRLEKRLKEIHLTTLGFVSKYPFESFLLPPELEKFIEVFRLGIEVGDPRVIILVGPPGCGKSLLLKALFEDVLKVKTLVVNDKEGLRNFDPSYHTGLIFDDPNFERENREQLIQLLDNERQLVRIRYTVAEVPANTPKAISLNMMPEQLNPAFADGALQRRMMVFKIEEGETLFNRERTASMVEESPERKEKKQQYYKQVTEYNKSKRSGYKNPEIEDTDSSDY